MDNFLCTLGAWFEVFMAVTMKIPEVSNLYRVDVLYLWYLRTLNLTSLNTSEIKIIPSAILL